MGSLMEKAMSDLQLVDISKHNFRRTLDSLQEGAHSLLLLSVQWKEIEGFFDSAKTVLGERAKELEALQESINVKTLALEAKEKELCSIHANLEKMEKRGREDEHLEAFAKRVESMEKLFDGKFKELEARAEELELKVKRDMAGEKLRLEFEPLVSLLAKSTASCADDLVNKNLTLARMVPCLDPGKLVLDAVEGSFREYLSKDVGEGDDRVVNSCIVLLEKLILMSPKITPKVRQEATHLGVDWIDKAKTNRDNHLTVKGCLLFLAAYRLAFVTTREVLLTLLDSFLLYDHAPKLFRLLRLEDEVSGVVESLTKEDKYLARLRFICEFRLYKLCPGGRPGALLIEFLDSSEKAARVIAGTGNSIEAQKARREKRKADAVMALECIREKKAESMFPAKTLKKLIALKNDESAQRITETVHRSSAKRQSKTNAVEKSTADSVNPREAKRQRLNEPITSFQNSTVNQLVGVPVPCGEKLEESGVSDEADAEATSPLSTEAIANILSGSINAGMLRELLEKQPVEESDLSDAIKRVPDPAKLVLDTSMALSPTDGGYEFKLLITPASFSLLLNHLKKLSPQIGDPVKGEAKELAVYWKDKISKSKTDELEVVCFLQFLGIFEIVSEFKANDLLALLDTCYWRSVSPDLCQFLGLVDAIPGFIENLIRTGHRLKAVDYIYSLDMVHRFQPVSNIINDSLRITKESAEKSFRDAKNGSASQVAAIERQIKSLRAAIRCITCHKLESEFQLGNLKEQIKSLLKLRENTSGSETKPGTTSKESQMAEEEPAPNVSEVGSVTSNTALEPSTVAASSSVSKPKTKKGRKRSSSGSTSHQSNRYPRHSYPLNQRETWPVDRYERSYSGTLNSDYSYNQWTQPEESQYYQVYHHHQSPFYRNHF